MKFLRIIIGLFFLFPAVLVQAQNSVVDTEDEFQIEVDIVAQDSLYMVKLQKNPSLFYFYVISGEPIPEIEDKELFVNIVDAEDHGWPVIEAGYMDTRYGVNEFPMNLHGKNFYLMATNGENYSKVTKFDFH